eukprot:TRINITY_DN1914_c0_g1_i1.p1 TRINITY_DN1914_c0_g1~~TRINITY_DN1914_c0_g1_i1.p1  ORF type:complete len:502 (+),score=32.70 TRINITY_DN1914_c0_g1_i1:123-1508(+)
MATLMPATPIPGTPGPTVSLVTAMPPLTPSTVPPTMLTPAPMMSAVPFPPAATTAPVALTAMPPPATPSPVGASPAPMLVGNLTTAAPASAPGATGVPGTAAPPAFVPPTAKPTTAAPGSPPGSTGVPGTAAPPAFVPPTAKPTTAAPGSPPGSTGVPGTAAPPAFVPPTAKPTTAAPGSPPGSTGVPGTAAPPAFVPPTGMPNTVPPGSPPGTTAEPSTATPGAGGGGTAGEGINATGETPVPAEGADPSGASADSGSTGISAGWIVALVLLGLCCCVLGLLAYMQRGSQREAKLEEVFAVERGVVQDENEALRKENERLREEMHAKNGPKVGAYAYGNHMAGTDTEMEDKSLLRTGSASPQQGSLTIMPAGVARADSTPSMSMPSRSNSMTPPGSRGQPIRPSRSRASSARSGGSPTDVPFHPPPPSLNGHRRSITGSPPPGFVSLGGSGTSQRMTLNV